ncbi:type II toxin-antitoxin system PemK/MazF family toxin [Lysinibacillus sp. NPDC094403]|uniref:type II toxin-antitoxin system PemK/MazF family toxin n=1 Tax=Lysinibacillus sp. NPDC094403 TaxID=3390581 RepID=UPI003D07C79C
MSDFLNKTSWEDIERGYEYEAAIFYPSDSKRPLSFFIPDAEGSTNGKILKSIGDFQPIREDGKTYAKEQMVVMTIKPRKVVILSSNDINKNTDFEYILVAPVNTVKPHEKAKAWYDLLIKDEHPIFTYIPKGSNDRYVDLSQIASIHKSLLLKKHGEVHPERMEVLENNLLQCLSLGIIENDISSE